MGKHIGICVIGAGRAGMIHATNFTKNVPGAKLVAVADPNQEAAINTAKTLGIDKYYTDYTAALEDSEIHAVVVVTPTIYHREIVVAAAAHGKHVLCEKPMAMTVEECDAMISACEQAGVKLQIGFMRRFDENFAKAKAAIEEGAIGDIVLVKSLTRGPSRPQEWMYDLGKSNGPLAEVNSHDIDTLRWFIESEFESVYAIGANYRCEDAREKYPDYYDNVVLTATFNNNKQGVIDGATYVQYGYDSRVEILGTQGVIFIGQVHDNTVVVAANGRGVQRPLMNSWRSLYKEAYLKEDVHFVDCIVNDRVPSVTGHDGKAAVAVVNAGNRSIQERSIVRL